MARFRLTCRARLLAALNQPMPASIALAAVVALWVPFAAGAQDASGLGADALARARASTEAGIRYEHGEGTSRDFAKAEAAYCEAAKLGHGDALVRLGWMYANGRGVARDDAIASTLFRRAASHGHEMGARLAQLIRVSQDALPACLRTGKSPGAVARGMPTLESRPGGDDQALAAGAGAPRIDSPAEFRKPPTSAERQRLVSAVLRMAPKFRLDPRLVMAVMQTESGFDANARSPKNAQGLMQLIPGTAERFAVRDAFDPIENLRGGMAYLRWLLAYFRGDVTLTLAAYNAGEGAVDRYRGVPPFTETMAYVQRIRAHYPFDRHPYDPKATAPSVAFGAVLRQVNGQ